LWVFPTLDSRVSCYDGITVGTPFGPIVLHFRLDVQRFTRAFVLTAQFIVLHPPTLNLPIPIDPPRSSTSDPQNPQAIYIGFPYCPPQPSAMSSTSNDGLVCPPPQGLPLWLAHGHLFNCVVPGFFPHAPFDPPVDEGHNG